MNDNPKDAQARVLAARADLMHEQAQRLRGETVAAFTTLLPPHKCGLYLEHNPHSDNYQTVAQWIEDHDRADRFASDEERERAIATGELWVLQWYPETPVGFHFVAASTLSALLAAVAPAETPAP